MENSKEVPQKIKNGTALWPSDSTSGNIFEETQNTTSKRYMHPYVPCSVIYNSQAMEATPLPINRWLYKKLLYIYTMYCYSAIKKNEILPF